MTPLSAAIGFEVSGLDLRAPVSPKDKKSLNDALAEKLLLVFRDQSLAPDQFADAVKLFGEPMRQHNSAILMDDNPDIAVLDSGKAPVKPNGKLNPVGSVTWHTDHTNHAEPPSTTCLYSIALPENGGGDTGFANMQVAYEKLPDDEKAELLKLRTVNTFRNRRDFITDEDIKKFDGEMVHPLIRTHPTTGKKAIYVHWNQMDRLEGQQSEPSRAFIKDLLERTVQDDIRYRHQWRVGDLVLIDNQGAMHKAMVDYEPGETRILHRIILKGGTPF